MKPISRHERTAYWMIKKSDCRRRHKMLVCHFQVNGILSLYRFLDLAWDDDSFKLDLSGKENFNNDLVDRRVCLASPHYLHKHARKLHEANWMHFISQPAACSVRFLVTCQRNTFLLCVKIVTYFRTKVQLSLWRGLELGSRGDIFWTWSMALPSD